jgi:hypothetical protein
MSAISSSTSVGSSLAQFLQQLQSNSSSSTSDVASTPQADATTAAASTNPSSTAPPQVGGHHHHGHGGGGLFKKIEAAVTSALQSAQSSGGSSDGSNVDSTIQSAIEKVLQQVHGGGTSGAVNADGDHGGDTTASPTDPSQATGTSATSDRQQFAQILSTFGVSESQFRADFKAAIEQAHNGQANPATALQSFPPGTQVDALA